MTDPAISPRDVREAKKLFARLNRELWIVTAQAGDRRGGLLATWVQQVSLDPSYPRVIAAIAPNHFTAALIDASGAFGLHLLREDQILLAHEFALPSSQTRDKFQAAAEPTLGALGVPLLTDCLARMTCRVFKRWDGGDRIYYWADVITAENLEKGDPLCEQEFFAALTLKQIRPLKKNLRDDVTALADRWESWRKQLPDVKIPR